MTEAWIIVTSTVGAASRSKVGATGASRSAPNILSDRLKLMERRGLVVRSLYSERPPRAQYALTEKGRGLAVVIGALASWGSRHVWRRAKLVHADCGHEVKLAYHCPRCGDRVAGATVEMRRAGRGKAALARR